MESIIINDGLHMHAIIIMRPGTRLKETLVDHFFKKDEGYRSNTWIRTIHVLPIDKTPEKVSAYALKAIGRHFDESAVICLPGPPPKERTRNWVDHYEGE